MPITAADVIAGTLRRAGVAGAEIHAKAIAADGDKMSAYRCTVCGLWHLGHTPKPRRGARNGQHN